MGQHPGKGVTRTPEGKDKLAKILQIILTITSLPILLVILSVVLTKTGVISEPGFGMSIMIPGSDTQIQKVEIKQGSSQTVRIKVGRAGGIPWIHQYHEPVILQANGDKMPGIVVDFLPEESTPPYFSNMTINVGKDATPDSYKVEITGRSGERSHTIELTVKVEANHPTKPASTPTPRPRPTSSPSPTRTPTPATPSRVTPMPTRPTPKTEPSLTSTLTSEQERALDVVARANQAIKSSLRITPTLISSSRRAVPPDYLRKFFCGSAAWEHLEDFWSNVNNDYHLPLKDVRVTPEVIGTPFPEDKKWKVKQHEIWTYESNSGRKDTEDFNYSYWLVETAEGSGKLSQDTSAVQPAFCIDEYVFRNPEAKSK